MNEPTEKLELLVEESADGTRLLAPSVGWFTCAVPEGGVVSAGSAAGVLRTLELSRALVVPAGVRGRVVNARPERVNKPVDYRALLYELAPLGGADDRLAEADRTDSASADVLAFCAPHSGRFWHRTSPKDPPLIQTGDTLTAGSIVGLIEVMKTFTHLHYEAGAGLPERARVVRILADDGAEVAGGDPLIELEEARS